MMWYNGVLGFKQEYLPVLGRMFRVERSRSFAIVALSTFYYHFQFILNTKVGTIID